MTNPQAKDPIDVVREAAAELLRQPGVGPRALLLVAFAHLLLAFINLILTVRAEHSQATAPAPLPTAAAPSAPRAIRATRHHRQTRPATRAKIGHRATQSPTPRRAPSHSARSSSAPHPQPILRRATRHPPWPPPRTTAKTTPSPTQNHAQIVTIS